MKKLAIFISVLLAGCASSHYNGPSFAQQSKICRADGHSMDTLPGCIEAQLDRGSDGTWRKDKKTFNATNPVLEYGKALGRSVASNRMTDNEAYLAFTDEINGNTKRVQAAIAADSARDANSAAFIAAGAALMSAGRPTYAPAQAPYIAPYPSDTVIIQQNVKPYRFIDSSPYK